MSALRKPPTNPETSYLATSTVDLNNAALCHVIAKMIKLDYSLYRLCLLTAFCITPSRESLDILEEAYTTTPAVSKKANPSSLTSVVHCGTVMCMSELLPRMFTPKHTYATSWPEMKPLCERLLRCTKYVPSEWTLSNGETVIVKTYVKHDLNQSDTSEGDRTATDESDAEAVSKSEDTASEVKVKRKRGRKPKLAVVDISGSDKDYVPSDANELASENSTQQYNLRPGRQRIDISGTDEETDVSSSWNEEDDSLSEKDTSEDAFSKDKVKDHLINGSNVKERSTVMERALANHNQNESEPITKRKRGRPSKEHSKKRWKGPTLPTKKPQKLTVIKDDNNKAAVDREREASNSAVTQKTTGMSVSSSAIATVKNGSTTFINPVKKPLTLVTNSGQKKVQNTSSVSASRECGKYEGPKVNRKEPCALLPKSAESNNVVCTSVTKTVNRIESVPSSVGSQKQRVRGNVKFPPYPLQSKSQPTTSTQSSSQLISAEQSKAHHSSANVRDVKSSVQDAKMAAVESLLSLSESINKSPPPTIKSPPPSTMSKNNHPVSLSVQRPPRSCANATNSNVTRIHQWQTSFTSFVKSSSINVQAESNQVTSACQSSATTSMKPTYVVSKVVNRQPLKSPTGMYTSTAAPVRSTMTPVQNTSHVIMPSSTTVSFATTSTNNTTTCSNINILQSSGPGVFGVCRKQEPVSTSPTNAQKSFRGSSSTPSARVIWTPTDNEMVTVEYNGKTFKVPVTNVPEGLSRNLQMASRGYTSSGTSTSQTSRAITTPQAIAGSPGRVISIQTPILTSNLNRPVALGQTSSPSRQVITVQTPVMASPNCSTSTVPYSTITDQRGVVYKVNIVPQSIPSAVVSSGIQIVSNVQNTVAVSTTPTLSTQVLSGTRTRVPGSNPVQVSQHSTSHIYGNSQTSSPVTTITSSHTQFVSPKPISRVGYLQGITNKFDTGGSTIPKATHQNVQVMGVAGAPTVGSPQRARQHMRIVHSPHRPMTRSQVAPTRPITRAYARDSPRFAPYNSVKHTPVKTVGRPGRGQVIHRPCRTGTPSTNGQPMKQVCFTIL